MFALSKSPSIGYRMIGTSSGYPNQSWLQTIENDLSAQNIGLSSAFRSAHYAFPLAPCRGNSCASTTDDAFIERHLLSFSCLPLYRGKRWLFDVVVTQVTKIIWRSRIESACNIMFHFQPEQNPYLCSRFYARC